ncbi:Hypothetical protein ybcI [Escherichia coli CFT073]|uniref:Membrane-bound metal-dependent hydrolase n=1 Tax=Escherichia coli O6:H1 (strain CFT073 / ATCC 700928 / UPEC) TaxID=199310 RepID=A0A0H2V5N8_ECOL6|nr:Hypothetical protein ybcI [Escherichia coli CFT073]
MPESSWRCCLMPTYYRLNLALLTATFLVIAGLPIQLVFAFVVPLLCVLIGRRWFRAGLIRCWLFLTVSLLSHSLLDSVTTGGKGVGWIWPWSDERFFAPWQVIKVAPFALSRYTTPYGHQVIISELMWVWLPGMLLMGMLWWRRR